MTCIAKQIALFSAFSTISACAKQSGGPACSNTMAESTVQTAGSGILEKFLRDKDAAGGEILVEFRKDDILGPPTHRKSCAFFLEPTAGSNSESYLWTAAHCLNPGRDSRYRLRFYVDVNSGYVEVPIEVDSLSKISQFRKLIEKKMSPELQREVLSAMSLSKTDFSSSKNATDICLNSFNSGDGKSYFHEPVKGANQIACFSYQDLQLIPFKIPANLNPIKKQLMSTMMERAQAFEKTNAASSEATLVGSGMTVKMSDFRNNWIRNYRDYSAMRTLQGFAQWAKATEQQCLLEDTSIAELCVNRGAIIGALNEAGLVSYADLIGPTGQIKFEASYKPVVSMIASHWRFYSTASVTKAGISVAPYTRIDLLTNYSWSKTAKTTFSSVPLLGFIGQGWGTTTDPATGHVRQRVGAATYDWDDSKNEMFIYAIIPRNQSAENLNAGYGQLRLKAGDSGSMILADGLPMAVLATVDGEDTSGGTSILPLPQPSSDDGDFTPVLSPGGSTDGADAIGRQGIGKGGLQPAPASCVY